MEHINQRGYTTEKILLAFLGGCIPIYYGSEEIFDIFNSKAFVYYNITHPHLTVEYIKKIEQNLSMYEEMSNEPILAFGRETVAKYFSFSNDFGNGGLKTKIRNMVGIGRKFEFG